MIFFEVPQLLYIYEVRLFKIVLVREFLQKVLTEVVDFFIVISFIKAI